VRMLFCFVNGLSHFEPLAPIARTAQASGHTVAVACGPSRVAGVEAGGFEAVAIGPSMALREPTRLPLLEVDMAREERDLRQRFADEAARRRAAGVLAFAAEWRPDVIVADETDFGAVVAAEVLDVPHATVLVLATGSLVRPDVVADTLDHLRRDHGLPSDPELAAPSRYLVLSPFPRSLRDPAFPLPATAHLFRAIDIHRRQDPAPPWSGRQRGRPTVYFTLGTQFNIESGDLFTRVLAGLTQLPADILVTVGHQIDPAELGPQPSHVHIERYIPQAQLLPYCDVVMFHAGSGTLTGALAHGLPMVMLAMGADQPLNAARCEALGVGVSLDPVCATPDDIVASVTNVLADPAYRLAAQRLQVEIGAQPEPASAVALLERLAKERCPIPATYD
jgi:UDP:flavonoid glycosyltransferase YjiC (YdhE family)